MINLARHWRKVASLDWLSIQASPAIALRLGDLGAPEESCTWQLS